MLAIILCVLAAILAAVAGRRSLVAGIAAVLAVGYMYGILRANVQQPASHFVFDAAVLGLYVTQLFRPDPEATADPVGRSRLLIWVLLLFAWPIFLLAIPHQDPLVQFVGLRGHVFFLPFLLFGSRLTNERAYELALWCAVLNIAAFALAATEFQLGIEPFFPRSTVTEVMYRSNDVAGYTAYRIPSSFSNAHAYAGTMVATLPLLVGGWVRAGGRTRHRQLLTVAILLSALGVFMSAVRSHTLVLILLAVVVTAAGGVRVLARAGWAVLLVGVAWLVSTDVRLQRITTAFDADYFAKRVGGSVNSGFFDLVLQYPLGNGLGGGGTSIPYFLQSRLENVVLMENEYARIMLEQGVPGLLLWIAFVAWVLTRRSRGGTDGWVLGRRLAWWVAASSFAMGLIGTGLLTAIPQTCLFLLGTGWVAVRMAPQERRARTLAGRPRTSAELERVA